jgi:hypothetical protein
MYVDTFVQIDVFWHADPTRGAAAGGQGRKWLRHKKRAPDRVPFCLLASVVNLDAFAKMRKPGVVYSHHFFFYFFCFLITQFRQRFWTFFLPKKLIL